MAIKHLTLLALACAVAACAPAAPSPFALRQAQGDTLVPGFAPHNGVILSGAPQARGRRANTSPIQHVVFVVQENRSFNNLFLNYPGATTQSYGYDSKGNKITLSGSPLGTAWDLGHGSGAFFTDCDGRGTIRGTKCKMDGWDKERVLGSAPPDPAYTYVNQGDITPYWTIAKKYALSDNTFASNLDGSFVAHQYTVAAYSSAAVDFPLSLWGCEGTGGDTIGTLTQHRKKGPPIAPCFDNPTIASEADAAGVTWRFYAGSIIGDGGIWSSYQADDAIYNGPDWKADVISPPSQFINDVKAGTLEQITWISPTFETSDHPGMNETQGPAWVASVVNAVGESKFWNSTAIFVFWDDWGGLFDPVKPVYEDYDGLGFRVPLLIVSPYTKRGGVTHVQYETASVLRYIEDNFGLGRLAAADARANDPANDPAAFDYSMQPRAFAKIGGSRPARYWTELDREPRVPLHVLGDD